MRGAASGVAGLFGIVGPTGAGKSTLVDALFLALYGDVPRNNSAGDFIHPDAPAASVDLTFAIARSGWYWEFVAIGVGGITLLALGVSGASAPLASPNRRVVLGTAGLCGLFSSVGSLGLFLAWRSISGL